SYTPNRIYVSRYIQQAQATGSVGVRGCTPGEFGRVRFRALRASAASALRRGQGLPLSPHYFSASGTSPLRFAPDKTGTLLHFYSSTGSACLIRERIREIVSPRQSPPEDRSARSKDPSPRLA